MRTHACLSGYQNGKMKNYKKAQQPTDSSGLSLLSSKITLLEPKIPVGKISRVRKHPSLTSLNLTKASPVSPDRFCHLSVIIKVLKHQSLVHLQLYTSINFIIRTQWHLTSLSMLATLWRFSLYDLRLSHSVTQDSPNRADISDSQPS